MEHVIRLWFVVILIFILKGNQSFRAAKSRKNSDLFI